MIPKKNTDIKEAFREFARTKDRKLRDYLVEKHLYIAEIIAKKYLNKGIEYDDLYQVASIALIFAVERFDVEKGFEFSSFATPTIIGEIKRYFRDKGWVIRVPRRIQELSKKVNDAKNHLNQSLQKIPTVGEIAAYLSISEEEVLEAMEASKVYQPQSLDQTYEMNGDDKEVNLKDIVGEDDRSYDEIEFKDFLERSMSKLNEVEKTIIMDRYFEKSTQVAIAKKLGISQMTVSRIEKKVLEKLKKELES